MKIFKVMSILLGLSPMSSVGYASHVTKPDKPDKVCIQKAFSPFEVTSDVVTIQYQDVTQVTGIGIGSQYSYSFTNPYEGIEIQTVNLITPEQDTGKQKHILIKSIGTVQEPFIDYSMARRCRNNC